MNTDVVSRNPWVVFQSIEKEIPAGTEEIDNKIKYIKKTWPYRPPEFVDQNWRELAELVNRACDYPAPLDKEWKIKIVAILTEDTEDNVREQFGAK